MINSANLQTDEKTKPGKLDSLFCIIADLGKFIYPHEKMYGTTYRLADFSSKNFFSMTCFFAFCNLSYQEDPGSKTATGNTFRNPG